MIDDCDVRAPEKDPSEPLDAADPRVPSIPDDDEDEVTYYLSLGSNSDSFGIGVVSRFLWEAFDSP